MEDEQTPGGTPPAAPPAQSGEEIKNLKAEFGRKLDNTNAQLQALMEQLQKNAPAPAPQKKLGELVYEDANVYTEKLLEEAEARIERKLSKRDEAAARQQAIISNLVSDFPELSQTDSDLTKKAVEIYGQMTAEEKANPIAYRAAVKEAALELGVKPKSKRSAPSNDDAFAMSSSGSNRPAKKNEIDDATRWFAEQLGRDPSKVQEVAKKRKNYGSWE